MDRRFDYSKKILVAVEFAEAPRDLTGLPGYARFRRLPIPEVARSLEARSAPTATGGGRFEAELDKSMGYWEQLVPPGKSCFVHYAIGSEEAIAAAFGRLKGEADGFALLGVYHVEPQCSAYPFSFPSGVTPDHLRLGETFSLTAESVFWFNFFPEQPYLFEKTFAIWAQFQLLPLAGRGENNQLVASEGPDRLVVQDVSAFVQINLNRFTNLLGFFESAREAGKTTFTGDTAYIWHGMLLRQI